jgi:hypothetical protein
MACDNLRVCLRVFSLQLGSETLKDGQKLVSLYSMRVKKLAGLTTVSTAYPSRPSPGVRANVARDAALKALAI